MYGPALCTAGHNLCGNTINIKTAVSILGMVKLVTDTYIKSGM